MTETISTPESQFPHDTEFRADGPAMGPLVAGKGDPAAADDNASVPCRPRVPHRRAGIVSESSRAQ